MIQEIPRSLVATSEEGPADDGKLEGRDPDAGKRLEAVDVVLALHLGENLFEMGGGLRGGSKKLDRSEGIRMTGSARKRWTLCWHCFSERFVGVGKGSRGKGATNRTGSRGFVFSLACQLTFPPLRGE